MHPYLELIIQTAYQQSLSDASSSAEFLAQASSAVASFDYHWASSATGASMALSTLATRGTPTATPARPSTSTATRSRTATRELPQRVADMDCVQLRRFIEASMRPHVPPGRLSQLVQVDAALPDQIQSILVRMQEHYQRNAHKPELVDLRTIRRLETMLAVRNAGTRLPTQLSSRAAAMCARTASRLASTWRATVSYATLY